jgi:hypothetical protein
MNHCSGLEQVSINGNILPLSCIGLGKYCYFHLIQYNNKIGQ